MESTIITQEYKEIIQRKAHEWLAQGESFTQVALSQKSGMGESYVSKVVTGSWDEKYPSPVQWQKLINFLSLKPAFWAHLDTKNFIKMQGLFARARREKMLYGISGKTGSGKTYGADHFMNTGKGTVYVKFNKGYKVKNMLPAIAKAMGIKEIDVDSVDLMEAIVKKLESTPDSLLILDECEFLPIPCWHILKGIIDETKKDVTGLAASS